MSNALARPQVTRSTSPPIKFVENYHLRTHEGPILPLLLPRLLIFLLGLLTNMDQRIILTEVPTQSKSWHQTLEAILILEATQSMMEYPSALWATYLLTVLLLLSKSLPHQMM